MIACPICKNGLYLIQSYDGIDVSYRCNDQTCIDTAPYGYSKFAINLHQSYDLIFDKYRIFQYQENCMIESFEIVSNGIVWTHLMTVPQINWNWESLDAIRSKLNLLLTFS